VLLTEVTSESFNTALLVVGGGLLAQIITGVFTLIQSRKNGDKTDGLHQQLNSRLTELLSITKTSSHAEGVIEGKASSTDPKNET
jgi:hypothetical protein